MGSFIFLCFSTALGTLISYLFFPTHILLGAIIGFVVGLFILLILKSGGGSGSSDSFFDFSGSDGGSDCGSSD